MDIKNVTVIGGGHIGTAIAVDFENKGIKVCLYSTKAKDIGSKLKLVDFDDKKTYEAKIDRVTDSIKDAIEYSNIIVVTYPTFILNKFVYELKKLNKIKEDYIFIILPSSGGVEFIFKDFIDIGCTLCCIQRPPAVYRLLEKGKMASLKGKRPEGLTIALSSINRKEEINSIIEFLFSMKSKVLPNLLSITLTPSNPILHPVRLYNLFNDYNENSVYSRNPMFYSEWNDETSADLIECDKELFSIIEKLNIDIDLSGIRSLRVHYCGETASELTHTISNINSLSQIDSPMIETDLGWIIDFNSRYFISDIPYGLVVLRAIADLVGVETPCINKIIFWYQRCVGKEYLTDEGILKGKDLSATSIPQNFGINSKKKLIDFYN